MMFLNSIQSFQMNGSNFNNSIMELPKNSLTLENLNMRLTI